MEITASRNLESSDKEHIVLNITWNPSNEEEDGLVALLVAQIDLIQKYNMLNTLTED